MKRDTIKNHNDKQEWNYQKVDLLEMPLSEELYGKIQKLIDTYGKKKKNPIPHTHVLMGIFANLGPTPIWPAPLVV